MIVRSDVVAFVVETIKANEAADAIEGDKSFRFLDGYNALAQALRAEAEANGAMIHLNTVVKEIRWSGDGVEAICEGDNGDSSVAAFRAIITLPLGVLQTSPDQPAAVRFIPELPPEKQTAIKNLKMGHVIRIVLSFRERFWETLKIWDQDNNPVKFADAVLYDGLTVFGSGIALVSVPMIEGMALVQL